MKRMFFILLLPIIILISLILGMSSPLKMHDERVKNAIIHIETAPNLEIHEGYVSQKEETVLVKDGRKVVATIKLGEPVMVAQAAKNEEWGYFQFPGIQRSDSGYILVDWHMSEDTPKSYGKGKSGKMMSRNEGKTWELQDQNYFTYVGGGILLHNGDLLQAYTPEAKDVANYNTFPIPVFVDTLRGRKYYRELDLPDDLRGVYLTLRDRKTGLSTRFQASLYNPGLLRYTHDGIMPVLWWGDMKELSDGTILAGIYPNYYQKEDGTADYCCITFYKSCDAGHHWRFVGKIPYKIDLIKDEIRKYDGALGFSEPTFEILNDSTFLCVMRTGHNTPMYKAFSYDKGHHWTKPEPFTPNGVKPRLLLLDNGVLCLTSGRPGVQIRFCIEGDGKKWTEPIEMLPIKNINQESTIWNISCGYSNILEVDKNTFYIVYSDFLNKNERCETRKSIIFRKISIKKV